MNSGLFTRPSLLLEEWVHLTSSWATVSLSSVSTRNTWTTCVDPIEKSPAMIYSAIGTGHMYRASVHGTTFGDVCLSVYNNTCKNPTCVETAYYHNSLEWYAELTTTYFVVIHDCGDLSSRGDYVFTEEGPPTEPPTTTLPDIIRRTQSPTSLRTESLSPSPWPTDPSGTLLASIRAPSFFLFCICVFIQSSQCSRLSSLPNSVPSNTSLDLFCENRATCDIRVAYE
eukprot:scaffold4200_cov164-Amphora_coffeaeformis.AAC.1